MAELVDAEDSGSSGGLKHLWGSNPLSGTILQIIMGL